MQMLAEMQWTQQVRRVASRKGKSTAQQDLEWAKCSHLHIAVPQEEDPLQPQSHPRLGSVCNGAHSSRWDGDRVRGTNHQTGEPNQVWKELPLLLKVGWLGIGLTNKAAARETFIITSLVSATSSPGHRRLEGAEVRGGGHRQQLSVQGWPRHHHRCHQMWKLGPVY